MHLRLLESVNRKITYLKNHPMLQNVCVYLKIYIYLKKKSLMIVNEDYRFFEKLKLYGARRKMNFSCKWQHVYAKNKIK